MPGSLVSAVVFLLTSIQLVAARRGGSSGDSGGGGGGGGGYGGGYGGDSGGGSGGSGGGYVPSEPTGPNGLDSGLSCGLGDCGCQQLPEREMLYGIPGLYYNGTLTVRHRIAENTAWDNRGSGSCGNNDDSAKTYRYPALFLAAPRGNTSDTNPFHWVLYGFQPADETVGVHAPYLDIHQRWVQIRSSDFVLSKTSYGGSYAYQHSDALYRNSDATNTHQNTTVYWPTNITDWDTDSFSARAVYRRKPPLAYGESYYGRIDVRTSQYVTLSDVCAYNQTTNLDSVAIPPSEFPKDNDYRNTTTPTVWLELGASAEMENVGANSMTFSLNDSLQLVSGYFSEGHALCAEGDNSTTDRAERHTVFEHGYFWDASNTEYLGVPWNLTVSISLSFEGDLVSENSTKITGRENGDVVFEATYETPTPSSNSNQNNDSGASVSMHSCIGVVAWTTAVFTASLLAFVG
ncbi:hypothetical protein ACJ41O_001534 [Fusarium nematophilum]